MIYKRLSKWPFNVKTTSNNAECRDYLAKNYCMIIRTKVFEHEIGYIFLSSALAGITSNSCIYLHISSHHHTQPLVYSSGNGTRALTYKDP